MSKVKYIFILFLLMTILVSCQKNSGKSSDHITNAEQEDISITHILESKEGAKMKDSIEVNPTTNLYNTLPIIEEEQISENTISPIRDITSIELIKEIKIGWNLGNTLDATGDEGINSEISWGNPFTAKENIDKVKDAGFNIIRIPTTWENHLVSESKISESWLNRTREIVDYAIDNNMYVILNLHHEQWHYPSYENLEAAKEMLTALWTQIGNHFMAYDEHLIFEGLNEPRMYNTEYEWTSGTIESRDVINQLNKTFIDTIRNLEGNNPLRHLMIPPYAASSNPDAWTDFFVPDDDKLIVSIHGYTPYDFALNPDGSSTFSPENKNDTKEIDWLMENIHTNFISKGIPVIIGEFGARDKNNIESRIAWSEYYVRKATEIGIPCIWWDNGSFIGDGENFGLLDRRNNTWVFQNIIDSLMSGLN